ncbi:hypothetical protein ACFYZE_05770 [Streptomyces sp. NPDC001796]|uniref:LppU/SCO3897 family protein n=1 Tax=Streptomyces sp. NPDC001796 TaxID=3364609 RepID=UPI0036C2D655
MTTPPPQGTNPYAQQPTVPMGQQPGQPGVAQQPYAPQQPYPPQQTYPQQQPYPPFPQQQGAPVPPSAAPAKRGGKKALRIIGAVVAFVIIALLKFGAGFGLSWFLNRDDAETTSVGACMHNDGTDSKADLKEVDCSSSSAQYKVVQKFDGSSDENKCQDVKDATISYIQYGGGHDIVLCLNELKK